MNKTAKELANEWLDNNVSFRGDHTQGMYMNVRDFLDVLCWAAGITGNYIPVSRETAIEILEPVAQKYLE